MEVRIRLQKAGKASNKAYNYRVVAMGGKEGRDGRTLDILGYYDPAKKSYFSAQKRKDHGMGRQRCPDERYRQKFDEKNEIKWRSFSKSRGGSLY